MNSIMRKTLLIVFFLFLISSCQTTQDATKHSLSETEFLSQKVDSSLVDDETISQFIAPYVENLQQEMGRIITTAEGSFERGQPEGALGNLIADLTRSRASSEMRENVDIAVLNNGGLRIPLPMGDISVGMVYELMPFDNIIAVLELNGEQILQMANELAACGGEPISGMRMRIHDGKAADVLIGSREVQPDRIYTVATNNWMADGGGCVPTLWNPLSRNDLPVLIRDAIIDHFYSREKIQPRIDNRFRG